jgi:hypothetical protein
MEEIAAGFLIQARTKRCDYSARFAEFATISFVGV